MTLTLMYFLDLILAHTPCKLGYCRLKSYKVMAQRKKITFFGPVTLELDLWPWNSNLTCLFPWSIYVPSFIILALFLQKLSCEQGYKKKNKQTKKQKKKQTDASENNMVRFSAHKKNKQTQLKTIWSVFRPIKTDTAENNMVRFSAHN
jgi:hypothetical protein